MFGRRKKTKPEAVFDSNKQKAVVRCSICNGEQVVGFKDIETGQFSEVMLIRNDKDLEQFKEQYGLTVITKEY